MKKNFGRLKENQMFLPLLILLLILLLNGILSGGAFFKIEIVDGHFYGRLIDILRNGSKLMILALGMTMVIATAGTDISVGSTMAISGAVACTIIEKSFLPFLNGNVFFAIFFAIISGVIVGSFNGFLVSRIKMQPIVATMILLVAGRGIAQLICKGRIVTINNDIYYFLNGGYIFGVPFPLYLVFFFSIIMGVFVRKTAFGLFAESVGCNQTASRFAGINSNNILFVIYLICGILASVAGLIESAGIKGADSNNAGLLIELDAILAVAIGGTNMAGGKFSLGASVIGALIIQSITTSILSLGIAPEITQVVKAIVVILICLSQSNVMKDKLNTWKKRKVS